MEEDEENEFEGEEVLNGRWWDCLKKKGSKNWRFLLWWRLEGRIIDWLDKQNVDIFRLRTDEILLKEELFYYEVERMHLIWWDFAQWSKIERVRKRFIVGARWLETTWDKTYSYNYINSNEVIECMRVHKWVLQNFYSGWYWCPKFWVNIVGMHK